MECTLSPPSGLWQPNYFSAMYYGPQSVQRHLLDCLPSKSSKAFIITGTSLATKTSLVKQVEDLLGPTHHAGTFSRIGAHAPVKDLDEATDQVQKDPSIDTIISIGGGSPIDSAKAISFRCHEKSNSENGGFLHHIAIPTTLSAAECTFVAGYTLASGLKTAVVHPSCCPSVILYDSTFAALTPRQLWLSTGLRAMDHAVELQYHPTASDVPCRMLGQGAVRELFKYLPQSKEGQQLGGDDVITKLQLASFASLSFQGRNVKGGLGLSHTFGYALGSPYGIPHGVTSCLTLGRVVQFKARQSAEDAKRIATLLPMTGGSRRSGGAKGDLKDAIEVGDRIIDLVERLGLTTTLTKEGVERDQIPVICERATGGKKAGDPVYEGVKGIVETLF